MILFFRYIYFKFALKLTTMKKIIFTISISTLSAIQMWAQCVLNVNVQPSCPSPNCNGIIAATPVGCFPPYSFTLIPSVGSPSASSTPFFTGLCPGSYTLAMMYGTGNFTGTIVSVPTATSNTPYITNVSYTPAPVPPYQPFQYNVTAQFTGGSPTYTVVWYQYFYGTTPPSTIIVASHTTNLQQDTITLYPGDYGVDVLDGNLNLCSTNLSTYTFSICDPNIGTITHTVFGAINNSGNSYTVCANSVFTVNVIPIPYAPVMIFNFDVYDGVCAMGGPMSIYTCSLSANQTLTVNAQWLYSNFCLPGVMLLPPVTIYADACLSTPMNIVTEQSVIIFPNPTKDKISVSSSANVSDIQIYDVIGNSYSISKTNNPNEWDIEHLSNGVYFIKIHLSNNNTIIKRFVVQK